MTTINSSPVSKPFVISAVILLFLGTSIGALWAMSLNGIVLPQIHLLFGMHRMLQLDGFVTLLIMGIGYMIVPRFRNIPLPQKNLAYLSYFFIIVSITVSFVSSFYENQLGLFSNLLGLIGVLMFGTIILWTIRITPKLLREADFFIMVSTLMLIALFIVKVFEANYQSNQFMQIQTWLLFPILMIFGVQYKTLPSFLGFIRPRKKIGLVSIFMICATALFGLISLSGVDEFWMLLFSVTLLGGTAALSLSLNVFKAPNSDLLKFFSAEKKKRFYTTQTLTRISFVMLYAGLVFAILYYFQPQNFAFYDLAIHFVAIGFIGLSIMLYLPLMLPPIINKAINFTNFNYTPLFLILISLVIRTVNDFLLINSNAKSLNLMGFHGWLVVAAMIIFVIMIHKGMQPIPKQNLIDKDCNF